MTIKEIVLSSLNHEWLSVDELTAKIIKERPTLFQGRESSARPQISNALTNLALAGRVNRVKKANSRVFLYGKDAIENAPVGTEKPRMAQEIINEEIIQLRKQLEAANHEAKHWKTKYLSIQNDFVNLARGIHSLSIMAKNVNDESTTLENRHFQKELAQTG